MYGLRWFGALTDRFMPPHAREDERSRFRFAIQAWLVAWPLAILWTLASYVQGLWVQVALNGVLVIVGPICWRGLYKTASLTPWVQLSLGSALVLYGPGMLGQTPVEETSLFFSVIIPLVAGFTFGGASAFRWGAATAVVSTICVLLGHAGYSVHATDPAPLLSKAMNIVSAMTMIAAFAASFHKAQLEALRRAEGANRAKSLFLATISHEIRTPMNGVIGMTEVLLAESKDAHQREQLEVIARSGELMVSLINDLLDLTKLEAQRLTLEVAPFDLNALVSDVARLYEPRAREKQLTLVVGVEPGVVAHRRGDSHRLRQVLFNLVSNAVKFTERGSITLTVRETDGRVHFAVHDTGIGIETNVQQRLFTVFEQADASTTRKFGGTGLGLALSRQLVTLLGGELNLTSTRGVGSNFWFAVPLEVAPQSVTVRAEVKPPQLVSTTRPRVLVVDDNPINLRVARSLVEKVGFEVHAVSSGLEAVEAARQNDYFAVLMDCHMPEMDGFEATTLIRALEGARGRVPIVALTASTNEEDFAACRRSGMNEVLTKPVTMDALRRQFAQYMLPPTRPADC